MATQRNSILVRCVIASTMPALFVLAAPPALHADELVVEGATFDRARILSLEAGRLRFRLQDGGYRTVPLTDVELLQLDEGRGSADFNEAERYVRQNEPAKSLIRYRRALRAAEGYWADLIHVRMLRAANRTDRIDESAAAFLDVLRSERVRPLAGQLFPPGTHDERDGRTMKALQALQSAADSVDPEQQAALMLFTFQVMAESGDSRTAAMAAEVARMQLPDWLRTEQAYGIVADASARRLMQGVDPEAVADLDRHLRECPLKAMPPLLLAKGRAMLRTAQDRDDLAEAAWVFMRVAVHMPDGPWAAEALIGGAEALERMDHLDGARRLLEECVAHAQATPGVRAAAKEAQLRLGNRNVDRDG